MLLVDRRKTTFEPSHLTAQRRIDAAQPFNLNLVRVLFPA